MAFVPVYILILGFTIVIDYFAGIFIETAQGSRRRWLLILSLVSNIGVLFVFKYFNFFNANLQGLAEAIHWNYPIRSLNILLPIGLSFHTFQAMSYTIEVYRGSQKAERHFGIYALYVMFYPQLVAGPIERPQNLIHQFYEKHDFEYARVTDGLKLMAWGFFKKIVIADRLAVAVNLVYNQPHKYTGIPLIIATYFFAFQIYCDFSGYTDIARGAARVMGFNLMRNFDRPYFARSVADFWTRWHISLSTWFKDYLFTPLARWHTVRRRGSDTSARRPISNQGARYFDIYVVFLISGLWHGANWTFLIWGGLHATYMVISLATKRLRTKSLQAVGISHYPRLLTLFKVFIVFNLLVFAWIFFRANNVRDAFDIVSHLGAGINLRESLGPMLATQLGTPRSELIIAVVLILFLEVVQWVNEYGGGVKNILNSKPVWLRWAAYYSLIAAIIFLGEYQTQQFIYFQF
jgi:D-alanyl-lipoteichoic acid acyltransferase DltB (MBOAT superfamily)